MATQNLISAKVIKYLYGNIVHSIRTAFNTSVFRLIAEGGVNFYRYCRDLGFSVTPNLVIMSSSNQYFCSTEEFNSARTIINLKKLNLIKYPDLFLKSLVKLLPPQTNFIGCFSNVNKTPWTKSFRHYFRNTHGKLSIVNNTESEISRSKSDVIALLEKNNFTIINTRELNGITYFTTQLK